MAGVTIKRFASISKIKTIIQPHITKTRKTSKYRAPYTVVDYEKWAKNQIPLNDRDRYDFAVGIKYGTEKKDLTLEAYLSFFDAGVNKHDFGQNDYYLISVKGEIDFVPSENGIEPLLSNYKSNNDKRLGESVFFVFGLAFEKAHEMGIFWKMEALKISWIS